MPGEPLVLQRFKVTRARNRGAILRFLRCKIGLHNPPYNEVFDDLGSLHIGGTCTRCGDETYGVVCYIGDYGIFQLELVNKEIQLLYIIEKCLKWYRTICLIYYTSPSKSGLFILYKFCIQKQARDVFSSLSVQ